MTVTSSSPPRPNLQRALLCWFGSLVLIGTMLVLYFGMPWLPLVLAGGITLLVTVIRYRRKFN